MKNISMMIAINRSVENRQSECFTGGEQSDTLNESLNKEFPRSEEPLEFHEQCGNNQKNNKAMKLKNVRFGKVRVCCFPVAPGDNPAVSYGPPIRLDYSMPHMSFEEDCNEFERTRHTKSRPLSAVQRKKRLFDTGFSQSEILKCSKNATIIKRQRSRTRKLDLLMRSPWLLIIAPHNFVL